MDWVHCNNCYVQPGDVEMKKFFITNCGHIYCDECLKANQSKECRICHIKYTTIPLTSNMNSEVEIYFHDPIINLKKQIKILEFQQSHRIRLVSHNRDRIRSFKTLEKENYNLNEELRLFKQENIVLQEEIKKLKGLLEYKNQREFGEFDSRNSQGTPRMQSFAQFLTKEVHKATPKLGRKNEYGSCETLTEGNFNSASKRLSNSNFFLMTESKSSQKESKLFTTPDLKRFPGSYRTNKIITPDSNMPPTPDSIIRALSQKDPLQRKVKLPSSRTGPSPATKLGFHSLSLSRPTSTPNKETSITNKYLKYFK